MIVLSTEVSGESEPADLEPSCEIAVVGGRVGEHVDLASGDLVAHERKGEPAKFEPPPTQPMTSSGNSPASSICASASRPITLWCSSTWLSTLPNE